MPERPVIVIVDDEPDVLSCLLDALIRRFGSDYRVISYLSAKASLEAIGKFKDANEDVALVIADQWMPEMTGRDFLGRARAIVPTAKRALMVGWGDRDASPTILQACALGELDNYLYKPWSPPEIHLYPFISEFLAEWTRIYRPGMELVRIVGDAKSPRSNEIRELLNRNGIPFGFHQAGSDLANRLIEERGRKIEALPAVFLHDGSVIVAPSDAEIMDTVGETPHELTCDVAVVGAGPAGLTAAVYAGSEGLRCLVIERHVIGGQAGASSLIRNYLGFPRGISGSELTQRAYQQAWLFGSKFVFAREVTALRSASSKRILPLSDGREIVASAVIVATGARYRQLDVPELERFLGVSIFYTTFGEARLVRDLNVAVTGGGNSAGQAAIHLAAFARHVTLIVRASSLEKGMSDYLVQQIQRNSNIDVRLDSEVIGGGGGQYLSHLVIRDKKRSESESIPTNLLFVLIGATPYTDWLKDILELNKTGAIVTGQDINPRNWPLDRRPMFFEASVPGVFAVGDVRQNSMKRLAAAVGEGAGAVQNVHEYLDEIARMSGEEKRESSTRPVEAA